MRHEPRFIPRFPYFVARCSKYAGAPGTVDARLIAKTAHEHGPAMPQRHHLLTLVESKGATIRVASGRVWVTEAGDSRETLLESGAEHVVRGDGRVVLEQEAVDRRGAMAEVSVCRVCELSADWRRALGES
jgi:hypothetical protein